ncbi:hypothetical protein Bca101_012720 [Brassica carinata]
MWNIFCRCLGLGGIGRRSNVPPATETTPLQPHPQKTTSPPPYVVDEKAVTVRNNTNLRKETLTLEPDPVNPGSQSFSLPPTHSNKGRYFAANHVCFEEGLGQKFIQPSGTGVDLSVFEDSELFKEAETNIIPLAIKMEAAPEEGSMQITLVTYAKEEGEIKASVIKQIISVNGTRYELQDIYGIGDTVDEDASDSGKECVVCLSEPRDMTVLPCRHMCMCGGCAKELRFQTNLCPVCRKPVERLLKIQLKG